MLISFITAVAMVILIAWLIDKCFIKNFDYWRKRGIPTISDPLPFVGHAITIFWSHKTFACFCNQIYRANEGRSMIGFFQFRKPNLMLRDPELIKSVLISDFPKFHQNVLSVDPKADPLVAKNPFFTEGEKWKNERNRLSYALMSGKRLRIMCHSVANVCGKFTKYLRDNASKSGKNVYEVEMKELSNRFTGEVVASAGFGVEGDFFIDGSGPNSFREAVQGFMEPTFLNAIMDTVMLFFPALNSILGISFLPKKMDLFFRRVIHEMMMLRVKDGITRNDFLQLVLDNRKNADGAIDDEDITASATSFFVDGYETSAITLAFFTYQMAANPTIQEQLRDEVRRILDKYNGEICYESLVEMTCMDRALNESMRLYPAVGFIVKKCTQRCKLVGNDGLECDVEPGTEMVIPIRALQRDSEYWENPDIYKPERFSEERKNERPRTVFLPFGEGPRICVGMRFAVLQIKGAMATMLKDFVIEMSPRTKRPLTFKRTSLLTAVEGGLWIKLRPL